MPALTEEESESIAARYLAGETIEALSLDLQRSPTTIAKALHARGLRMRKPGERGADRKADPKRESEGKIGANDPRGRIARSSASKWLR